MKIKYLLIAALAGVALVGCNKEGGADVNGGKDTNNFYATFNIVAPASSSDTKADDGGFAFGAPEEAAVQNIRFIFYRNGSKVAISATDNFTLSGYTVGHVIGDSNNPESPFEWTDGTAGGSVEKIAQAKVILRYIRMMIYKSRIIKQKGRLQLESSSDKLVIKNNFGRPYLSFNIEKTK